MNKEDRFYASCNRSNLNFIDRVNGKPVRIYHYSIDRPDANWRGPKTDRDWEEYYSNKNFEDWEEEEEEEFL